MSEFSCSKLVWERERKGSGAMESCYKLYTWINHTVLMLLFQIFWKVSQISDYFTGKPLDESESDVTLTFPISKDFKFRRHIRSMSDVQSSTPYRVAFRSRKGSSHTLMYDSDTRAKRIRTYNRLRQLDSSDSSDCYESSRKLQSLEQNILKHTDSIRIL